MLFRISKRLKQQPLVLTTLFYVGGLLIPALVLRAFWFQEMLHVDDLGLPSLATVVAASLGTASLLLATPWLMRFEWAQRVATLARGVFGSLTLPHAVWLGLVSGFCEELLFRGALQPMIGLVPAAVAFALAHLVGGWWLFAFLMGLALGGLYSWDGNLWPCVLVHSLLNTVNLYRLSRGQPAPG